MLLALAGVSAATMAQQKPVVVEQVDIIQVQDKYQVITNPFWSNLVFLYRWRCIGNVWR